LAFSKKTLYHIIADKRRPGDQNYDHEIELRNKEFDKVFSSNLNAIDELFEVKPPDD
jgi:hypothetical protein